MYACKCRRNNVSGLGFITELTELVGAAAPIFSGDKSSGASTGGAMMPSSTTVSPAITTQVSPQISPVFQQQFQPSGSPMSAGTAQSLPGISAPAASDSGFAPVSYPATSPAVPSAPQIQTDYAKYIPWVIGGGLVLFALKQWGKGRGA